MSSLPNYTQRHNSATQFGFPLAGTMQLSVGVRPHPGPLPQGEGEPLAARGKLTVQCSSKNYRKHLPLPGGEGRGEGGLISNGMVTPLGGNAAKLLRSLKSKRITA
jgi:hypothetical protein